MLPCDAPNPALGVKRGCHHFFFIYKLIAFKFVQSYNVKHLTCTISCSSGLQNIYKLHTWKCSTFTRFTLLHLFTNNKKDITKEQNIGNYGYIGTWILWKYRKISVNILKQISVDILTKISVMQKLTKIL